MKIIQRESLRKELLGKLRYSPVVLLLGPRQCGKTTLAREVFRIQGGHYFDLEDPQCPLQENNAAILLRDLRGLVVIDEFQSMPGLFSLLRVLSDRRPSPARFLILGSSSPSLVRGVSESLAGRVSYQEMSGFDMSETQENSLDRLWIRGGFPLSYLASVETRSLQWRLDFIRSFLERDIPMLGIRIPAMTLRRFWTMLAHYHGQLWNAADLARSMGSKEDTARKYLDILTDSFLVRQLPPWFENVGKRAVKAPRVYIRDSGLLHALLGLKSKMEIMSHPKLGFSWEGFALEQVIRLLACERESYFYRTYAGAELDLLIVRGNQRYGFEFKFGDSPKMDKSMRVVMADLKLRRLWVIYPGKDEYPLAPGIDVLPMSMVSKLRELIEFEKPSRSDKTYREFGKKGRK